jgi:hypothetical protein
MSTKTINPTIRRWAAPVFSTLAGVAMCAAFWVTGRPWPGVTMLVFMLIASIVLVVFRRSEPIALLAEESTEERRRLIQLRAGYFAANVLAIFIIGGFFVDVMHGGDGDPWALLGFIGGVSFIGALVVLSRRS